MLNVLDTCCLIAVVVGTSISSFTPKREWDSERPRTLYTFQLEKGTWFEAQPCDSSHHAVDVIGPSGTSSAIRPKSSDDGQVDPDMPL